ncbi:MAG: serine--tRNA ligase, partial [Methanosarcinales archaeon]
MGMRFELTGCFRTSANIDHAVDDITGFFRDEASKLLSKGVPQGRGALVEKIWCEGQSICFKLVSDRYLRAHDGVLRLRRPLAS